MALAPLGRSLVLREGGINSVPSAPLVKPTRPQPEPEPEPATIFNTHGDSALPGSSISGFMTRANALAARLAAKGF